MTFASFELSDLAIYSQRIAHREIAFFVEGSDAVVIRESGIDAPVGIGRSSGGSDRVSVSQDLVADDAEVVRGTIPCERN